MHTLHSRFPLPAPPRTLPVYSWRDRSQKPNLLYCTNHIDADAALDRLPPGPLGFDLEWRPTFRKGSPENPVALVQLATADTVILLHIRLMSRKSTRLPPLPLGFPDVPLEIPTRLVELLASPLRVKAGVNIRYDCAKLYNDYKLAVCNCVELSFLARTVDNSRWKGKYTNLLGLARLVETYEHATLLKGRIQRSNWEQFLDQSQQEYAANDAHAGYVLYSRLFTMAQAMAPVPTPVYYSFSLVDGLLCDISRLLPWHPHNPCYDPGPPPPTKNAGKDTQSHPHSAPDTAHKPQQDT